MQIIILDPSPGSAGEGFLVVSHPGCLRMLPMSANTILVVDDEKDLLDLVTHHLKAAGFSVVSAATGVDGLQRALAQPPDLVILDVMLPDLQGTEILKRLRANPGTVRVPVILLTARGEETDRVVGFELGADDYVVKPFSPRELVLRARALIRRTETTAPEGSEGKVLERGGIRLDPERHEVRIEDSPVDLTALEFRLLAFLMERPGRVLSRERLLEGVWCQDVYVTDRTVDTHIKRLRSKLGPGADQVETIRGVGYRFR